MKHSKKNAKAQYAKAAMEKAFCKKSHSKGAPTVLKSKAKLIAGKRQVASEAEVVKKGKRLKLAQGKLAEENKSVVADPYTKLLSSLGVHQVGATLQHQLLSGEFSSWSSLKERRANEGNNVDLADLSCGEAISYKSGDCSFTSSSRTAKSGLNRGNIACGSVARIPEVSKDTCPENSDDLFEDPMLGKYTAGKQRGLLSSYSKSESDTAADDTAIDITIAIDGAMKFDALHADLVNESQRTSLKNESVNYEKSPSDTEFAGLIDYFYSFSDDIRLSNTDIKKLSSRCSPQRASKSSSNASKNGLEIGSLEDFDLEDDLVDTETTKTLVNDWEQGNMIVSETSGNISGQESIADKAQLKHISLHPIGFAPFSTEIRCENQEKILTSASEAAETCSRVLPKDTKKWDEFVKRYLSGLASINISSFREANTLLFRSKRNFSDDAINENFEIKDLSLLFYMNAYIDILFTEQNHKNSRLIRFLCAVHVLNHVSKFTSLFKKNSRIMKALERGVEPASTASKAKNLQRDGDAAAGRILKNTNASDSSKEVMIRDQGLTRPRILLLAPFKSVAKEFVEIFVKLLPGSYGMKKNYDRFCDDFGSDDSTPNEEGADTLTSSKPDDHSEIFGGNQSDCFRMGIKFLNKGIFFYSSLDTSDIIVASPLGLKLMIGNEDAKMRETDFLSSIEILIIDRLDVIDAQNFLFLKEVMKVLNKQPNKLSCDIRRLRSWNMEGKSAFYRQTILLSNGLEARYISLLRQSSNYRGFLQFWNSTSNAMLLDVASLGVRQAFQKIGCEDFSSITKSISAFFEEVVLPKLTLGISKVLLVVPTYLDYLRIFKQFKAHGIACPACHEYSSNKVLSNNRRKFFHGQFT